MNKAIEIISAAYKKIICEASLRKLTDDQKKKLMEKAPEELLDKVIKRRPDLQNIELALLHLIMRGYEEKQSEFLVLLANGGSGPQNGYGDDDDVDALDKILDIFEKADAENEVFQKLSFKDFSTMTELKTLLLNKFINCPLKVKKSTYEAMINSDYILKDDTPVERYQQNPIYGFIALYDMGDDFYNRLIYLIENCDMIVNATNDVYKQEALNLFYYYLARNRSVSNDIIREIIKKDNRDMLISIARRPNLEPEMIQRLLDTKNQYVYCSLSQSETKLSADVIKQLLTVYDCYIRLHIAERDETPDSILIDYYVKDHDFVETLLKARKNISDNVLLAIVEHGSKNGKLLVMRKNSPLLPKDAVEKLKNDADALVRTRAKTYEKNRLEISE
jgi:hypothetical protein